MRFICWNSSRTCRISFDKKKRHSVSDRLSLHWWMVIWKCITNLHYIIYVQIRSQNFHGTTSSEAASKAVKGVKSKVDQDVTESEFMSTKTQQILGVSVKSTFEWPQTSYATHHTLLTLLSRASGYRIVTSQGTIHTATLMRKNVYLVYRLHKTG